MAQKVSFLVAPDGRQPKSVSYALNARLKLRARPPSLVSTGCQLGLPGEAGSTIDI